MAICDEGWYKTAVFQKFLEIKLEATNVIVVRFYFTFVETQTRNESLRTRQKNNKKKWLNGCWVKCGKLKKTI